MRYCGNDYIYHYCGNHMQRKGWQEVKQPKKLTRNLKQAVTAYGLNADNWMLLKDGNVYVTIINKQTGSKKIIDKYARGKKGARI